MLKDHQDLAKEIFDTSIRLCLAAKRGRPLHETIESLRILLDSLEAKELANNDSEEKLGTA